MLTPSISLQSATYDAIYQSMAAARAAQPPVDLRMSASTARAFKVYQPTSETASEAEPAAPSTESAKRTGEGATTTEKRVRIAP